MKNAENPRSEWEVLIGNLSLQKIFKDTCRYQGVYAQKAACLFS
jgi:hypothetical protein